MNDAPIIFVCLVTDAVIKSLAINDCLQCRHIYNSIIMWSLNGKTQLTFRKLSPTQFHLNQDEV